MIQTTKFRLYYVYEMRCKLKEKCMHMCVCVYLGEEEEQREVGPDCNGSLLLNGWTMERLRRLYVESRRNRKRDGIEEAKLAGR